MFSGAVLREVHQTERNKVSGDVRHGEVQSPGQVPRSPRKRQGQEGRVRQQAALLEIFTTVNGRTLNNFFFCRTDFYTREGYFN